MLTLALSIDPEGQYEVNMLGPAFRSLQATKGIIPTTEDLVGACPNQMKTYCGWNN